MGLKMLDFECYRNTTYLQKLEMQQLPPQKSRRCGSSDESGPGWFHGINVSAERTSGARDTPLKFNSWPMKNDGWKTIFPFLGVRIF